MPTDYSKLESELKALRAQNLDPEFMDRVESCADDTWTEVSGYERHIEKKLLRHQPSALSESMMDSLLSSTQGIPFPSQETIVSFPGKQETPKTYWWRAAAVVAVMGVMSAFMVPIGENNDVAANPPSTTTPSISPSIQGSLIPAQFSRKLTEATDEGIIWQDDQQPQRVVKVVYQDRVTMKDTDGQTYEVEQPRVEYYILPAQSD